jgi:hypothetical protein
MTLDKTPAEVTTLVTRLRQHVNEIEVTRKSLPADSDTFDQLSNQIFDIALAADWLESAVQ